MQVRKRPVVVEAVRFIHIQAGHIVTDKTTWGGDDPPDWLTAAIKLGEDESRPQGSLYIGTFEDGPALLIEGNSGTVVAQPGDWIMMQSLDDIYPVRPQTFDTIYESA